MAHRSFDEICVRQVSDPIEAGKEIVVETLMYEQRAESIQDETTHEAKFHKELFALFKKTETKKQNCTTVTVFPVAAQAVDAQVITISHWPF